VRARRAAALAGLALAAAIVSLTRERRIHQVAD